MQENKIPLEFNERADTFHITVILQENDKLKITLIDLVSNVVYEKEYTEDDIESINKKLDAKTIYQAFFVEKKEQEQDEEDMGGHQSRIKQMREYRFGEVISDGDVPCYKIEKGGKLTVYWMRVQRKGKQPVVNQTLLELPKIKNLNEREIAKYKQQAQKLKILGEMKKQKEEYSQKNLNLEKKIQELSQERDQLKNELLIVKEQLIKEKQKNKDLTINNEESSKKIKELQEKLNPIIKSQNPLTLQQPHSNLFKFGLTVQYIGPNNWTHYILNQPINHNESAKFRLKIIRTQKKHIMVGIVDYARQKDQRQSSSSGNAMCYWGQKGLKYPVGKKEGDGFGQGDIVQVDINRADQIVKYLVNDILVAFDTNKILGESTRVFMPYFEMMNTNDVVQWAMD